MAYAFVKIGDRFGRLTVIGEMYSPDKHASFVKCRCDCGTVKDIRVNCLRRGTTTSCGCFIREIRGRATITHGLTNHPLYAKWCAMKERCSRPANKKYALYGGRGIRVCDEWLHDFKAFYDWSIANGWAKGLEIDRIDSDGNYCPENCRYISHKQNTNNKRNNHIVTFRGEQMTLTQAIEKSGCKIEYRVVSQRINKCGYSVERALTEPMRVVKKHSQS